jgi:hypothetical protein
LDLVSEIVIKSIQFLQEKGTGKSGENNKGNL